MSYKYRPFLAEMNALSRRLDDPAYVELWQATKADVASYARSGAVAAGGFVAAHADAWSRWEDLYTDPDVEPEEGEDSLHCAVMAYKEEVAAHLWSQANYWTEVAFARGRGFSREDGIAQQEEFLAENGGWEAFYGIPRPGARLRLIQGGRS